MGIIRIRADVYNSHISVSPAAMRQPTEGSTMLGLQITQLDHVSILVTDIERSRRYYRDLLGLKEIAKPRTFGFKVLWLDLGNQHLHLLVKDKPDAISPRHFALRLNDVHAARSYVAAKGIAVEE